MTTCTCAMTGPARCPVLPHRSGTSEALRVFYADPGDLVPGYADSADGLADARDQRKADYR